MVEHYLDTVRVTGSNPVSRTRAWKSGTYEYQTGKKYRSHNRAHLRVILHGRRFEAYWAQTTYKRYAYNKTGFKVNRRARSHIDPATMATLGSNWSGK